MTLLEQKYTFLIEEVIRRCKEMREQAFTWKVIVRENDGVRAKYIFSFFSQQSIIL